MIHKSEKRLDIILAYINILWYIIGNIERHGNETIKKEELKMKLKELFEIIDQMKNDERLNNYWVAGIRFEDKERKEGDVIEENSKHNLEREDERDFPEYGTDEYNDMFELDGVSAWDLDYAKEVLRPNLPSGMEEDVRSQFIGKHCYIIAGDNTSNESDALDYGEVVIVEPKVIKVVY